MSWTETHERYRIIREVVRSAETDPTGALPWRDEYATLFGSPDGLVAALRSRWQRTCEAQLEAHMSDEEIQTRHRQLLNEHAGVLRILDRYVAVAPRPPAMLSPVA
jgi:hypothetical protein